MTETLPVLANLSDREKKLVTAARRGGELVCSNLAPEALATSEDPAHVVRAELIRELLLGRRGELDPRGIVLYGARITGQLDLNYITTSVGVALVMCHITNPVVLNQAHLPWLHLASTRLPSLWADGLQVDGTLNLQEACVTGSDDTGIVRLFDARIGILFMDDAVITNSSGPAVSADRLQVSSNVRLRDARLSGIGDGVLGLNGARIDGQLDLDRAVITADTITTIALNDATVGGRAFIAASMICPEPTHTSSSAQPAQIKLDGFTFGALPRSEWREWLHLIRCHTPRYRPQPYQQLAAAERAAGHDNNARRILIAQQQDLHKRAPEALGGWWNRRFHSLWGALAGYGYRARRTAVALLIALLVVGALGFWAGQVTDGNHHAAERTASFNEARGERCSPVELVGVGLDRGLPLSPTGVRARCDLNTGTTWGQVFTVSIWLVQAAIWGLATLALAGYTSLIRKTA